MNKAQPQTRHIISINDLTNKEIETIFEVAQGFLKELADDHLPYRVARSTDLASKFILASLFYEPSTRTRLSFESAMLRLGGANITSADPAVSSAAKGESLADTIRVISNYADIVVIRHPRDGAARLAAEYAQVPVINGGDGAHEHPTQTLCDLFTLRAKNKNIGNMKVAISGDLKGSRTIHSFVYALARFGATIDPLPAPGMELPAHVDRRLREEFNTRIVTKERAATEGGEVDALYVTANQPHQLSLYAEPDVDYGALIEKKTDAVYVTRFQKERYTDKASDKPYPKIDAKLLSEPKYSDASVMHPLPRVNELDASFDTDRRAVYFQQAAYGVPVRMALISLMLHLHKNKSLHKFGGGFATPNHPVYVQPIGTGVACANKNCITCDPAESQYAAHKFYVIEGQGGQRLRCVYCEADIDEDVTAGFVAADTTRKTFSPGLGAIARAAADRLRHFIIFASEAEAKAAGFAPRDTTGGKARAG
jgi:aspartate carbamoyltransferase catalytic subunit